MATTFVIANNLAKAQAAARAREIDVIEFLPNKNASADRLRGITKAHILVTNVRVRKELMWQLRMIDRGGITFDWIAV